MISPITYRSFQLFLVITCVKIATAILSEISARRVTEFRHKLENTNWDFSDQANNANDPNTAYNIFIDKYTGLFDACFPFKTIKGKALNSLRKPWLTKSLLRSINKKNKLYKQYLRHRSNEKLLKYKTYKNKLTDLLRVAKRLYTPNSKMAVARTNLGRAAWKRGIEGRRQIISVFTYGNRVRSCLKIAQFHTVLRKCMRKMA